MPKRATSLELALPPREPGAPAYTWLYSVLRADILAGRLKPGTRLPPTRELALHYALSRGTIVAAFEGLKAEGYVEGVTGSGTYVSKVLPENLLQVGRTSPASPSPISRRQRRRLSSYGRRVSLFENYEDCPTRAFRTNLPALELFPVDAWTQTSARCLRRVSASMLRGCDAMGYMPLRQTVADYLMRARGLKCQPKQVAIVSGVQEALDLCARLFLNPGDRVCLEDPGYPGAGRAFEAVGAKITAVGVDEEGIQLSKLRSARLIYVTPAHQFPLGITMSLPRRLALLEKARQNNALIFEDDYDSEFRYSGRPVPALQGLDRHGCVLFAGSFSKVMFPSLRLGYLVVPDDLVDRIAAAKSITSRHAPLLEQAVLCEFMDKGLFGRHIRRMREVYADRLSALLESARQRLSGLLEISDVEAGLQTVGWLSGRTTAEQVAKAADTRGLQVFPISRYSRCPYFREGIQLGFAAITPPEIRRGINELARVLEFGSRKVRD